MYHPGKENDTRLAMDRLGDHIAALPERFKNFSDSDLLYRRAPGKWSRKEILGHLVDSAINNLKRFTEIQFLPQPYTIAPYRQNELVVVNHYQDLPLEHLLDLWQALNRQIIYVVNKIPEEKWGYTLKPYDTTEMKSFAWIICDYVAHMEHHFQQL